MGIFPPPPAIIVSGHGEAGKVRCLQSHQRDPPPGEAGLFADRGKDSYYIYPDSDGATPALAMTTGREPHRLVHRNANSIVDRNRSVKRILCRIGTRILPYFMLGSVIMAAL